MGHKFVLRNIERSSQDKVSAELEIDGEQRTFAIAKGRLLGYTIPGELEDLDLKRIGKVRELLQVVEDFDDGI